MEDRANTQEEEHIRNEKCGGKKREVHWAFHTVAPVNIIAGLHDNMLTIIKFWSHTFIIHAYTRYLLQPLIIKMETTN